jgi:hypothetical protein
VSQHTVFTFIYFSHSASVVVGVQNLHLLLYVLGLASQPARSSSVRQVNTGSAAGEKNMITSFVVEL